MENVSELKTVLVSATTTLNSGGTAAITSAEVDTIGYDFCKFVVLTGTVAASGEVSVLKAQSSDTSGSGFADAIDAGTNPIGAADDDSRYELNANLVGAKRYWQIVASTDAAADCPVTVIAILGKADKAPAEDAALIGYTNG